MDKDLIRNVERKMRTVKCKTLSKNVREPVKGTLMAVSQDIDELWLRMSKMYGHKFTSTYGTLDDGTWCRGLSDLAPAQLGVGLSRCVTRKDPWPPNLPEFRGMCLPTAQDLGIPDVDEAYQLATVRSNSGNRQEAVQRVVDLIGVFELRTGSIKKMKPIFDRAYKAVTEKMLIEAAMEEHSYYMTGGKDGQLYIANV